MSNLLARAIKAAVKPGKFRAADDEDETPEDENVDDTGDDETDDDEDKEAGEDDEEPEAAEDDGEGDDEQDPDAGDDEDDAPEAAGLRSAINAVREEERSRCIAIFTHANAESNPNLAAKLLSDGTSQSQAASLLDAVGTGTATAPRKSLAERVRASQGGKKPGQDGHNKKSSTGKDREGTALVASASRNFGQNKAARKQQLNR